ncbi:hypothetical protein L3Q82_000400 [Scortum barcoo]|uniref:Uncharacterized protein n=1 Tax=Scortum barcoo TaxID=214431 RepID=A0ACB8XAD3_9TELE|nr:hypothetical protein L3Q82_000400 [Scortum barcoo]
MFHHQSLGVRVNIRVTKLVLLHNRPEKLKVGHYGERSLESFCHWQYQEFGGPRYIGTNHVPGGMDDIPPVDTAVLVTSLGLSFYLKFRIQSQRVEFVLSLEDTMSDSLRKHTVYVSGCLGVQLSVALTKGIAYLGGVCSAKRKCVLAEDNGLNLAFTIAHELGHKCTLGKRPFLSELPTGSDYAQSTCYSMGMSHDDDHATCTGHSHIMSGEWVKGRNPSDLSWSPCSRDDLENFLREMTQIVLHDAK